jgi:L-rhamnose mutarotase
MGFPFGTGASNKPNPFNIPSKNPYLNEVTTFLKYYYNDIDFSRCTAGNIEFYVSPDNGIIYITLIRLIWYNPFAFISLPNIIFYTGEVLYDKEKILNEDFDFGKVKSRNLDIEEIGKQLEASIIPKVEDWLKEHGVKDYSIESTGDGIYVDVNNHLNLANYKMMSLPNYFQFRRIAGNCNLANNLFTSWNNMP